MGCSEFGVTQILVGLHRVGVVGLRQALLNIESSSLLERDSIVDRLLELLAGDNFIPKRQLEDYKVALWREYLRFTGSDFSDFFSSIEVDVWGEPGPERNTFVNQLGSVFAEFELKPIFAFHPAPVDGPSPQLRIADQLIVRGQKSREKLKAAIRMSFSDW